MFGRIRRRLWTAAQNLRRVRVYYVGDKVGGWSVYWDGYYITRGLRERAGVPAVVVDDPWRLKGKIIHFGNRYAFLNGPYRDLHPSNHVMLTWFHGDPADPNPDMQRTIARMKKAREDVEKFVVTCRISRDVLLGLGIPAGKITAIPLGVELKCFVPCTTQLRARARAQLAIPKDALCIGSFQKDGAGAGEGNQPKLVKGPDIFLKVMEKLARRHAHLFVLLTGPARGYVKRGLHRLGIPSAHHILSEYRHMVNCYHASDLCLVTSRAEGGPKALLEGWATGVPVVSTRVGMPADLIRHGQNGMLADLDDVAALAAHAEAFIEDSSLRDRCLNQALQDVKPFDWSRVAQMYYDKLYKPLLEPPRV